MDRVFLNKRLKAITREQSSHIDILKERKYYILYSKKLATEIGYRGKDIRSALECIDGFYRRELRRMKITWFCRSKLVLKLACVNAADVVRCMQRWDGVDNSINYAEKY